MKGEFTDLNEKFKLDFINGRINVSDISHIVLMFDNSNILIPVVDNQAIVEYVDTRSAFKFYGIQVWCKEEMIIINSCDEELQINSTIDLSKPIIVVR